jgi:hypothetical protein
VRRSSARALEFSDVAVPPLPPVITPLADPELG